MGEGTELLSDEMISQEAAAVTSMNREWNNEHLKIDSKNPASSILLPWPLW